MHSSRYRLSSPLVLATARRTESGLLTEGILDANVDESTPGSVRVALWREWESMLNDLPQIGPVWSIVRNGHCVLAVEGNYPQLAYARNGEAAMTEDGTLTCHFRAWHEAVAFENSCCCGTVHGIEIANKAGLVFHRICLTHGTEPEAFAEWAQMHQATGLEIETDSPALEDAQFHPQSYRRRPGTLEVPAARLRTALLNAAQREIPLIAGVPSEGVSQSARIEIAQASEAQGWLLLSGQGRSLYLESEPTGTLLVEPVEDESGRDWRLALVDENNHCLLRARSAADDRPAWRQLIREFVLQAPSLDS